MKKPRVSIIVPGYNEEGNIGNSISSVVKAIKDTAGDYEIIVVNDGSSDGTGETVKEIAKDNKKIRLINNSRNRGFGYSFKRGIKQARMEYISGFPGDNDMSWESLRDLIRNADKADLVSTFMVNPGVRSFFRRTVSRLFVIFLNLIYGLHLKYYNGHFISKSKLMKNMKLVSDGIILLAEIKIRLLKKGASFTEIPFEHRLRQHGSSKAFSMKNVSQTVYSLYRITRDIYL